MSEPNQDEEFGEHKYTVTRFYPAPPPFLSRVYDCKHRFEQHSGCAATQLFLGPKERMELSEYVAELEILGLLGQTDKRIYDETLAGMTIIVLATDGMRAGISST